MDNALWQFQDLVANCTELISSNSAPAARGCQLARHHQTLFRVEEVTSSSTALVFDTKSGNELVNL